MIVATTIKEIFNTLTPQQKAQLVYALEHNISQHIELENKKFIGVNTEKSQNLIPTLKAANWAVGDIK